MIAYLSEQFFSNQKNTATMKITFILCTLIYCNVSAQTENPQPDYDAQIKTYLDQSKKLRTAGWIALGGGFIATGIATAIAPTAQAQDIILFGGFSSVATATYLLQFKASSKRNHAKLLEIQRDLGLVSDEAEREQIFSGGALYFKKKVTANRIPAIILSGMGGIVIIGMLTSPNGTHDPYASASIPIGLANIAASIPFYIRAAQLSRTSKSLKQKQLPHLKIQELSPTISTNRKAVLIGFRIAF